MSATVARIVPPDLTRSSGAFSRLIGAWRNAITRYLDRRAAIATLRDLDDHVLQDIGLDRSQIKAAVHGFIPLSELAGRR